MNSSSFSEDAVKEVMEDPEIFVGIGHGCMYGVKHVKTKQPLKKPTLWFSTSPEICQELSKTCSGQHEHGQCMGGKTVTEHAGRCTVGVAKAIQRGFVRTLQLKDSSRIRSMLKSVQKRLTRGNSRDKTLEWKPKQVGRAVAQWVGAVGQEERHENRPAEKTDNLDRVVGKLGIAF